MRHLNISVIAVASAGLLAIDTSYISNRDLADGVGTIDGRPPRCVSVQNEIFAA
jgi:hypothetical protein